VSFLCLAKAQGLRACGTCLALHPDCGVVESIRISPESHNGVLARHAMRKPAGSSRLLAIAMRPRQQLNGGLRHRESDPFPAGPSSGPPMM
jgi:hypothetical protein